MHSTYHLPVDDQQEYRCVTLDELVKYYYDVLELYDFANVGRGDVGMGDFADSSVDEWRRLYAKTAYQLSAFLDCVADDLREATPEAGPRAVRLDRIERKILTSVYAIQRFDNRDAIPTPKYHDALRTLTSLHDTHGYPTPTHAPSTSGFPAAYPP